MHYGLNFPSQGLIDISIIRNYVWMEYGQYSLDDAKTNGWYLGRV
jgi:hypothetical protein